MKIHFSTGNKFMCDKCGYIDSSLHKFNTADSYGDKDYCLACHPQRMTYMQLIEWLAKGNGYVCLQVIGYRTHLEFDMAAPVRIEGKEILGSIDSQIPYDEHNFVVRYFDKDKNRDYWNIPTEEMFYRDCRGTDVPDRNTLKQEDVHTDVPKVAKSEEPRIITYMKYAAAILAILIIGMCSGIALCKMNM
ncbi:MAG: hypothetical protein IK038_03215 [Bacteroidaceae bacterium]|nr:hypothetical protein [Bacteroidaceae bacterium]